MNQVTYAEVAVPLPIFQTFTYSIPPGLTKPVRRGGRVVVPFGKRLTAGLVTELHEQSPETEVKEIRESLDGEEPVLTGSLLDLGLWISQYYFAPPGQTFRSMLPPLLLSRKLRGGSAGNRWPSKTVLAVTALLPSQTETLTARQQEVLEILGSLPLPQPLQELLRRIGCSESVIRSLASKGRIALEAIVVERSPWSSAAEPEEPLRHCLTEAQAQVVERIRSHLAEKRFNSMLLHGVTGSGKTEVYLHAIARALELGRSALLLVPEIGLTPQTSRSFRAWFGERVAILHSSLSQGERFDEWRRIRSGRAQVVVGTRSAVFAPLKNLGILVIDEEHDSSYKQEELPRYHARDTALKRAQLEGALIILGSATPQLETYYRAATKKAMLHLSLGARVAQRPLPTVHIVDMRVEFEKKGKGTLFSEMLEESIQDRLQRGQQVLILMNRRGYSSALLCRSCGHVEMCRQCSISLTFHLQGRRLTCHYCNYSRSVPEKCGECGKTYLFYLGEGTEKVEEHLVERFPSARIGRLDRDAAQGKGRLDRILRSFAAGRTDILIGTQMIAKGHDFSGVTLVGVLSAEQSLRLADFRAAERTFQLLTQVAGRAGRGDIPGEVVIQTYFPNHYSLKYACHHDYLKFAQQELSFRRHFSYPPFTALANLLIQGRRRDQAAELASWVGDRLGHWRDQVSHPRRLRVLGPAPAAIEQIKGQYRFQILIKTTHRGELHQVIRETVRDLNRQRGSTRGISIDIDPVSLL